MRLTCSSLTQVSCLSLNRTHKRMNQICKIDFYPGRIDKRKNSLDNTLDLPLKTNGVTGTRVDAHSGLCGVNYLV